MEGVELTAEKDLNGRNFNYVVFHVSIYNIFLKDLWGNKVNNFSANINNNNWL